MKHKSINNEAECPACIQGVSASKTKVGEAELLCELHKAQLNGYLSAVVKSHPDVDEQGSDLVARGYDGIESVTNPPKPITKNDTLERILVDYGRILQRVSPEHSLTKKAYRQALTEINKLILTARIQENHRHREKAIHYYHQFEKPKRKQRQIHDALINTFNRRIEELQEQLGAIDD